MAHERLVATRHLQGQGRACDRAAACLPPSRGGPFPTPAVAQAQGGSWLLLPQLEQPVAAARDGETTQWVHRKGGDPQAVDALDLWVGAIRVSGFQGVHSRVLGFVRR